MSWSQSQVSIQFWTFSNMIFYHYVISYIYVYIYILSSIYIYTYIHIYYSINLIYSMISMIEAWTFLSNQEWAFLVSSEVQDLEIPDLRGCGRILRHWGISLWNFLPTPLSTKAYLSGRDSREESSRISRNRNQRSMLSISAFGRRKLHNNSL